jgi:hypothetical protein
MGSIYQMWLNSLLRLTIKCQLETSMAETRKSTPKEKTAKAKEEMLKDLDKRLDSELADTFPASDPPSLTQPTVEVGGPDRKRRKAKLRPRG